MMYRRLTTSENVALAAQLSQYADWHAMQQFVQIVYGPNAARVQLDSTAEYNDEDYSPEITFTVYDAADNELQPDLTQEQAIVAEEKRQHQATQGGHHYFTDDDVEYRIESLFLKRVAEVAHIPHRVGLDWETSRTYDLTQTPTLPALYVESDA